MEKATSASERLEQLDRVERHIHENPSDEPEPDRELLEFIDTL